MINSNIFFIKLFLGSSNLKIKLKHSCSCLENLKREICILISRSQLLDRLVNEPLNFKNPGYICANSVSLALQSYMGQD